MKSKIKCILITMGGGHMLRIAQLSIFGAANPWFSTTRISLIFAQGADMC
jgi:hypothetical protein